MRTSRRLVPALAVLAVAVALPAAATAAPGRVSLDRVSGPTPFPAGCPGAAFDDTNVAGQEIEPNVTANRANPNHLVAAWIQDTGPDSLRSDVTARSHNGGRTWTRTTIPGLTICEGGTADAAGDPWVSSGVDGTVYFGGLAVDWFGHTPHQAVVVTRSSDEGRSWAPLTRLAGPAEGDETPAVTGDPIRPGRAYQAWAEFATFDLHFSRTTDRGRTWSPATLLDRPGEGAIDLTPRVLVLPDGRLVTIFARVDFLAGTGTIYATRSGDGGRTWTAPVALAGHPLVTFADDAGEELVQPQFPNAAVAPDGTIYVTVEANDSATSGIVSVVASRDGGVTWKPVTSPGVGAYAFEPAIAVDPHGTVGVSWYDLRRDRPGDAPLTADVWFASSRDHGATWHETHVAGPTDLRTSAAANRVGEYQGLAATGPHRFVAIVTLPGPFAQDGPTDIFAALIREGA
jgi:BNR repeat-like domain